MAGYIERDECCLFVGNLDSRVTEEILWELFLQAAPLNAVHIPKDKETGRNKTFGFVSLSEVVSVPFTISLLNGITLYGKPITVKQAQGNTNSPLNQSVSNSGYGILPPRMSPFENQNGQLNMFSRSGSESPMSDLSPFNRQPFFDHHNRQMSAQSSPIPLISSPSPVRSEIESNSMNSYTRPRGPWDMMSPWQQNATRNQNFGNYGYHSTPSQGSAYSQGTPHAQGRWRR